VGSSRLTRNKSKGVALSAVPTSIRGPTNLFEQLGFEPDRKIAKWHLGDAATFSLEPGPAGLSRPRRDDLLGGHPGAHRAFPDLCTRGRRSQTP
jgi:hypothetical protein